MPSDSLCHQAELATVQNVIAEKNPSPGFPNLESSPTYLEERETVKNGMQESTYKTATDHLIVEAKSRGKTPQHTEAYDCPIQNDIG